MQLPFAVSKKLTRTFVLQALYSHQGPPDEFEIEFSEVCTDSRRVSSQCLFVAIPGEKFDGHDFIDMALKKGARGILCRKNTSVSPSPHNEVFFVDDPIEAYRRLASAWRKKFSIPVVAVAGSAGKTTTKELLAAILSGKWNPVLKTQGSQNGMVGIPMTLLELNSRHQAAVIEVGIDAIGTMEQHMEILQPEAALLTSVGPEHLEGLKNIETVAREEGNALHYVGKNNGLAVIHLDDPWIAPLAHSITHGEKIGFSLLAETTLSQPQNPAFPFNVVWGQISADEKHLTFWTTHNNTGTALPLPLPGRHNASNTLAAIAMAMGLGLTPTEILEGIKTFQGAQGRSEIRYLPNSITVICDFYNAQPASMNAGLELLNSTHRQAHSLGKRFACLGDMLELGPNESDFHRSLAPKILQSGIENVLLYGHRMKFLYEELRTLGFPYQLAHFSTHAELAATLSALIRPHDVLLIKGSRGMKMEQIWSQLSGNVNANKNS